MTNQPNTVLTFTIRADSADKEQLKQARKIMGHQIPKMQPLSNSADILTVDAIYDAVFRLSPRQVTKSFEEGPKIFEVGRDVRRHIIKLKDGTGHYIWTAGEKGSYLLGYPVKLVDGAGVRLVWDVCDYCKQFKCGCGARAIAEVS